MKTDNRQMHSHSMRENYEKHGVEGYYQQVSGSYRNPHFDGIVDMCVHSLNRWLEEEYQKCADNAPIELRVLDLACGSGEATLAVETWIEHSTGRRTLSNYSRVIRRPRTKFLGDPSKIRLHIDACDPFTGNAYLERTGRKCWPFSFLDIANGILQDHLGQTGENECETGQECEESETTTTFASKPGWDVCVCSFAAHLIPAGLLWQVLYQLASCCQYLLILAPHKQPEINETNSGWQLLQSKVGEQRVHGRLYRSLY